MTSYSFNGFTIGSTTIDLETLGLLVHGATTFQALVIPKNASELPRDVPVRIVCSNLRVIDGDRGASHRVRARGEAAEITELEDGLVVVKGAVETFMLN